MRRRRTTVPRLESMEDRMVPSAPSTPLSLPTQAQIHRMGRNLTNAAHHFQQDLNTLIQNRMAQMQVHHAQWPTHHASSHHTHNLFGIPFLNF
jgi:hypothetical protein